MLFPPFLQKNIKFAMVMAITGQQIAYFFYSYIDSQYQIGYFECICT